jgi:hypothetical protein
MIEFTNTTEFTPDNWPEPPIVGDEVSSLLGALERQRATLAWKCGGIDAAGMRATLGPSTVTLGGLLKHLAFVEAQVLLMKFLDRSPGEPWESADWKADRRWDWNSAAQDTPEQLFALWQAGVARSRTIVDAAIQEGGLDTPAKGIAWPDGTAPSLRRLLFDLLEEYARHVGHADLIRESIDGLVGEDPAL